MPWHIGCLGAPSAGGRFLTPNRWQNGDPAGTVRSYAEMRDAERAARNVQGIGYAAQQGVPLAALLVPASGLLALAGGLSILAGYHARIGAWLLVLFLVPVTLTMHRFWEISEPTMAQMQQAMFFKNLSMLGGALLIAHFGAGPLSFDARTKARASQRASG